MLLGGNCEIPNCVKYGQKGCDQCRSPFKLQSGLCTIEFCEIYDQLWTECKVCRSGYHIEKSGCVLNDPKC